MNIWLLGSGWLFPCCSLLVEEKNRLPCLESSTFVLKCLLVHLNVQKKNNPQTQILNLYLVVLSQSQRAHSFDCSDSIWAVCSCFFKKGVLLLRVRQEKPWSLLGSPFPEEKGSSEVFKGRMRECGADTKAQNAELLGIMCCMGQ